MNSLESKYDNIPTGATRRGEAASTIRMQDEETVCEMRRLSEERSRDVQTIRDEVCSLSSPLVISALRLLLGNETERQSFLFCLNELSRSPAQSENASMTGLTLRLTGRLSGWLAIGVTVVVSSFPAASFGGDC